MSATVALENYKGIFAGGYIKQVGSSLQVCLETNNLQLLSVNLEDRERYVELYSDPETAIWADREARTSMTDTATSVDVWIQRWKEGIPFSSFAIYHRQNSDFVGHIMVDTGNGPGQCKMVCAISNKHEEFASEAIDIILTEWLPYLHQRGYHIANDRGISKVVSVITAISYADHAGSNHIWVKNGFTKTEKKVGGSCSHTTYEKHL